VNLISWIRNDVDAAQARLQGGIIRLVPAERWGDTVDGGGSTLHHLLLHLTRHHDLAVNTVIRDRPPLYLAHRTAMGLDHLGSAVGVSEAEDRGATAGIHHDALLAYAQATFDGTRHWLDGIGAMVLDTESEATTRLAEHADIDADRYGWLHDMWSAKPVSWMVQWPVIGHTNTHLGEMVSIRNRMGLSPF
jgi:hypothetical protein